MCRILINPDELADTASLLATTAGEYQAIGAEVAYCNCGCMPADVAAVVDAITAEARSVLQSIAAEFNAQASGLGWRSGVDQNGPSTAISAAWGGAGSAQSTSTMNVGGFDGSLFGGSTGGTTLTIGGTDGSLFTTPVGTSTISVGGYGGVDLGTGAGNSTITISGSDLGFGGTSGGTPVTLFSTPYDPSATLAPTGDLFWDNPEAWLAGLRPASRAWAESGFMLNIPGVSMANAMGHWGNVGLNSIVSGGEYRWNDYEGSNYFVPTGDLVGTRV